MSTEQYQPVSNSVFVQATGQQPAEVAIAALRKNPRWKQLVPEDVAWFASHVSCRVRYMFAASEAFKAQVSGSRAQAFQTVWDWAAHWADDYLDDVEKYKVHHPATDGISLR